MLFQVPLDTNVVVSILRGRCSTRSTATAMCVAGVALAAPDRCKSARDRCKSGYDYLVRFVDKWFDDVVSSSARHKCLWSRICPLLACSLKLHCSILRGRCNTRGSLNKEASWRALFGGAQGGEV